MNAVACNTYGRKYMGMPRILKGEDSDMLCLDWAELEEEEEEQCCNTIVNGTYGILLCSVSCFLLLCGGDQR